MSKMLTVSQAAQALGVKPATIRSWIWKGQIGYVKISRAVRITTDEVERFIECGTRPAVTTTQPEASTREDRE